MKLGVLKEWKGHFQRVFSRHKKINRKTQRLYEWNHLLTCWHIQQYLYMLQEEALNVDGSAVQDAAILAGPVSKMRLSQKWQRQI